MPRPLFPPGKDPVPIVQEAGWAPGPVWISAQNLAPSGFDPRTVQPVASRYTDYANRPTDRHKRGQYSARILLLSSKKRRYIYTFYMSKRKRARS